MAARSALLLGATGLVGGHCLDLLLEEETYERVVTLGRRPLPRRHTRLVHHVVDFDDLSRHAALVQAQDVFCCLGTTIKRAGSQQAFRQVDLVYPQRVAQLALANGAEQYLLVSALGADSRSRIFYNRVKGEVEEALAGLPFYGVYLFRPSLLEGERAEVRRGEQVAERVLRAFSFALRGPLRKYRPTPARLVATSMIEVAGARPGGVQIYEPDRMQAVAGRARPSAHQA